MGFSASGPAPSVFILGETANNFIVARGRLRQLLGCYLGKAAPELTFHYGPRGKSVLYAEQEVEELCSNLSHSQGLALYAVAWGRRVGVDLEAIRSDITCQEIVEGCFSPQEQAIVRQVPPSLLLSKPRCFLRAGPIRRPFSRPPGRDCQPRLIKWR